MSLASTFCYAFRVFFPNPLFLRSLGSLGSRWVTVGVHQPNGVSKRREIARSLWGQMYESGFYGCTTSLK